MLAFVLALTIVLGAARPPAAHAAIDLNVAFVARIARADSAQVFRMRELDGMEMMCFPGPDRLGDFVVEREGMAGAVWRSRIVEQLGAALRESPSATRCRVRPQARARRYGIRFFVGGRRDVVVFFPDEHCAEIWSGRELEGSADFTRQAPRVIALLEQAVPPPDRNEPVAADPRDAWLQRQNTPVATAPQVIAKVAPVYPGNALAAAIGGTVMVAARIGTDGRVAETRIMRSVPLLDGAASDAVRRWTFVPAFDGVGRPVSSWVQIPVRFTPQTR